jgi:hypothetical protein
MLCQPSAGSDDFQFHQVGRGPVVVRDRPPDGINIFRRLRRELK